MGRESLANLIFWSEGLDRNGAIGTEQANEGPAALRNQDFGSLRGLLHVIAEVVAELVGTDGFHRRRGFRLRSGAEGIRTPGLRRATAALCQLSYSPESVLLCPV